MRAYPLSAGLVLLLAIVLNGTASGQEATPAATSGRSSQDLAKSVHNPFEDFIKVPIEADTNFGVGPRHNVGQSLNIEPVFPFHLNSEWDLIARPNLTLTYLPSPHAQFGLEDLQTLFYLTPSSASEWIWGLGPIFEFPTATNKQLGTGKWAIGPNGALVYSNGPWFNELLAYHLISFAGDRGRASVSLTYLEPQISYNFESGWYVDTDPQMTFDWRADSADAWTIPVGVDVGKAFNLGSRAMSLQLGAYDFVKHPQGSARWMLRVTATLLFPTTK
jgi:hypothetical protein